MPDVMLLNMGKDLEGASQLIGYEKQIELLNFGHGVAMQVTNDVSNTERTSGKPAIADFSMSKYMDKPSPKLNQKCCEVSIYLT